MTPRKPDRFERLCQKEAVKDTWGVLVIDEKDALKLLREEHQWTVRMIKKVEAWSTEQLAESDDVIAAILDQLHRRRHG